MKVLKDPEAMNSERVSVPREEAAACGNQLSRKREMKPGGLTRRHIGPQLEPTGTQTASGCDRSSETRSEGRENTDGTI